MDFPKDLWGSLTCQSIINLFYKMRIITEPLPWRVANLSLLKTYLSFRSQPNRCFHWEQFLALDLAGQKLSSVFPQGMHPFHLSHRFLLTFYIYAYNYWSVSVFLP